MGIHVRSCALMGVHVRSCALMCAYLLTLISRAGTAAYAALKKFGRGSVGRVHMLPVSPPVLEPGAWAGCAVPVLGLCLRWRHFRLSFHRLHLQKDFST